LKRPFRQSPICCRLLIFSHTYECEPIKITGARNTHTTSTHNPLIMASSSSAYNWGCGGCASSNKGGKYCTMCTTSRPKRQAVLAVLAAEVAAPTAVVAVPTVVAKAILSAPMPGAVIGVPALVAKKAKALKESAPSTLDKYAVRRIVGANDGPRER
jgi:hypothetical protein